MTREYGKNQSFLGSVEVGNLWLQGGANVPNLLQTYSKLTLYLGKASKKNCQTWAFG